MLRGRVAFGVYWFRGFLVSWFIVCSGLLDLKLIGFLVSKFLGLTVSWFLSLLVSGSQNFLVPKFLGFKVFWV